MESYKRNVFIWFILALSIIVIVLASVKGTAEIYDQLQAVRRVIADVDPGIDDIEALVCLIDADNKHQLKLEAIIVTEGNTNHTNEIRNVFLLLELLNRTDIPVHLGAQRPILEHDVPMGGYYGQDGLGDLNWTTTAPVDLLKPERAFATINNLVKQHPNEITYMTMGPMSTLAITILLYPQVVANLNGIYAMGGMLYNGTAEFNVKFDPEAVDIVLRAMKSKMLLVTVEAGMTNSPAMDWYHHIENVTSPAWMFMTRIQDAINQMLIVADDSNDTIWGHCDPIVPAVFLNESIIVRSFTHPLVIEVGRGEGRGLIRKSTSSELQSLPVHVVLEIDYQLLLKHFVAAFESVCDGERNCREVRQT